MGETERQMMDFHKNKRSDAMPSPDQRHVFARRVKFFTLSLVAFVVLGVPAFAQRSTPPLPGLMKYFSANSSNGKLQVELRTSREQMILVFALRKDLTEQYSNARSLKNDRSFNYGETLRKLERTGDRLLKTILNEKQIARLRGIHYQQLGNKAFQETSVRKLLELTKEQQKLIDKIIDSDVEDRESKIVAVLTDAQKSKWKSTIGKPFKIRRSRR